MSYLISPLLQGAEHFSLRACCSLLDSPNLQYLCLRISFSVSDENMFEDICGFLNNAAPEKTKISDVYLEILVANGHTYAYPWAYLRGCNWTSLDSALAQVTGQRQAKINIDILYERAPQLPCSATNVSDDQQVGELIAKQMAELNSNTTSRAASADSHSFSLDLTDKKATAAVGVERQEVRLSVS